MKDMIGKTKRYLKENLGIDADISSWPFESELPLFLKAIYKFKKIQILNFEYILITPESETSSTPATIEKHINWIQDHFSTEVIVLSTSLLGYDRKRLINRKIPFIVPGKQMYLPIQGIDFREHTTNIRSERRKGLSPSAQAFFLYCLYEGISDNINTNNIIGNFRYTKMTISRIFSELNENEILVKSGNGHNVTYSFKSDKKSIWNNYQKEFQSPVTKSGWILKKQEDHLGPVAGLSALSQYTNISEPNYSTIAVNTNQWQLLKDSQHIEWIPKQELGVIRLEKWNYNPELFSKNGVIDPLSLYLSLRNSHDERVSAASNTLLGKMLW